MKDFELRLIFPEIWETLATYQTLEKYQYPADTEY